MNDIIKDYYTYLFIERGLSKNTTAAYIRDVKDFIKYCDKDVKNIKKEDINKYLEYLGERYSSQTVRRKLISLRQFFIYLYEERLVSENILADYDLPKNEIKLPTTISIQDINQILTSIDQNTLTGKRDYVMITLLINSGMRVSEMINLDVNDINLRNSQIKVIGKGDKERLIPLDEKTCDILKDYIENDRSLFNKMNSSLLFFNLKGRDMTRENFYNILNKRAQEAGITAHITPHKLRHTFATTMLENDADLRSIQELLGHSDISTTTIYTHVANDKMINDYSKYHPRNRKEKENG